MDRALGWRIIFPLVLLSFWRPAEGRQDFQIWSQIQPRLSIGRNAFAQAVAQWRFGRGTFDQLLTDLNVSKRWGRFTGEMGLTTMSRTHPLFSRLEWRPWAGVVFHQTLGAIQWNNRARAEFRFLAGMSHPTIRMRFLTDLTFAPIGESGVRPFVDEELFLHVAPPAVGPASGLDQNRLRAGVRWAVSESARLDAAYMHLFLRRPGVRVSVHTPVVALAVDLDGPGAASVEPPEFIGDNPQNSQ